MVNPQIFADPPSGLGSAIIAVAIQAEIVVLVLFDRSDKEAPEGLVGLVLLMVGFALAIVELDLLVGYIEARIMDVISGISHFTSMYAYDRENSLNRVDFVVRLATFAMVIGASYLDFKLCSRVRIKAASSV